MNKKKGSVHKQSERQNTRRERVEIEYATQYMTIWEITRSHQCTLCWLQERDLISITRRCTRENCPNKMARERDNSIADGFIFRCRCGKAASLRTGTIFEDSKLTLIEQVRIIFHYFPKKISIFQVAAESGITRRAISGVYAKIRNLISAEIMAMQVDHQLGEIPVLLKREPLNIKVEDKVYQCPDTDDSNCTLIIRNQIMNDDCQSEILPREPPNKMPLVITMNSQKYSSSLAAINERAKLPLEELCPTVDIDESHFFTFKIEGEKWLLWFFGMVDRATKEARAWPVKDRTAGTLTAIIEKNIKKGATIYSDGWSGYSKLKDHGYVHRVVNHSIGFGEGPDTTNNIESVWSQLKANAGFYQGINFRAPLEERIDQFGHYVNVALWFRANRDRDIVDALVDSIAAAYDRFEYLYWLP